MDWTQDEVEQVKAAYLSGLSIPQIAIQIGTSEKSVRNKLARINISVKEMKRRVPVNSGKLRNSIHAERQRADKDGFVQYRVVVDAQNEKGFKYAKIVEFSPKIQKPYMYPSFDALRGGMKENVIRKIQEAVHAK